MEKQITYVQLCYCGRGWGEHIISNHFLAEILSIIHSSQQCCKGLLEPISGRDCYILIIQVICSFMRSATIKLRLQKPRKNLDFPFRPDIVLIKVELDILGIWTDFLLHQFTCPPPNWADFSPNFQFRTNQLFRLSCDGPQRHNFTSKNKNQTIAWWKWNASLIIILYLNNLIANLGRLLIGTKLRQSHFKDYANQLITYFSSNETMIKEDIKTLKPPLGGSKSSKT